MARSLMVTLGVSGQTPTGTYSMMFIYTYKEWDDVPWQLIVLNICLVSLQPLTMCLVCKYF